MSADEVWAIGLFDFAGGSDDTQLPFKAGDKIKLLGCNPEDEWWEGELDGKVGMFPASYVEKTKRHMAERTMEISDKIKSLQQQASLPPVQEATKPSAAPAAENERKPTDGDESDDDLDEVEKENALLRKGAEQMLGKLSALKAELDLSKQAIAALEAKLAATPTIGADDAEKDEDIKELTEENDLLRKSSEVLIGKLQEVKKMKEEVDEKLKETQKSEQTLLKTVEDLKAEIKGLKEELTSSKATTVSTAPAAVAVVPPADATNPAAPAVKRSSFARLATMARAQSQTTVNNSPSPTTTATPATGSGAKVLQKQASSTANSKPDKWGSLVKTAVDSNKQLTVSEEVKQTYQDIRRDNSGTTWGLFKYDDAGKNIILGKKGSGTWEEFRAELSPTERAFAFAKINLGDQRNKFVFFVWCGTKVPPLKKARVVVDKAIVKDIVRDFALEVFAVSEEELATTTILTTLKKASGADYGSSTN